VLELREPSFAELALALARKEGRRVAANYGLNPRLGKYHRTYCAACESIVDEEGVAVERCPYCGSGKIVRGVMDRIRSIADRETARPAGHHPPYHFQVPLPFLPGVGAKTLRLLLDKFGTEMNVLHRVSSEQLREVAGEPIAEAIMRARAGTLNVEAGGGGRYGKIIAEQTP
jgi:uncharacterized protein (TIGR00375 family)